MSMLEKAKLIAKLVHFDEKRRNGEPYILHCDRVEESLKNKSEIIQTIAQLHDVLENAKNPDTIRLLLRDYFPFEVTHLVETLTKDKNIYYTHYIDVVCNNHSALEIKFADLIDNTKDIETNQLPEKQFKKYRDAVLQIISRGKIVPEILKQRLKIEDKK